MTQLQLIENHLLKEKTITAWQAIQLYRITCLNKMIQLLRKKYSITSIWQYNENTKTHFVEYKMKGAL